MTQKIWVLVEKSKKSYIGTATGLPDCRTKGSTYKELLSKIRKAIRRCLKLEGGTPYGEFVGIRTLSPKRFRKTFIALIEKGGPKTYVGYVPSLSCCFTQAENLEKLIKNLEEVVEICFDLKKRFEETELIGVEAVEVK